jgi:hypothetical protein
VVDFSKSIVARIVVKSIKYFIPEGAGVQGVHNYLKQIACLLLL